MAAADPKGSPTRRRWLIPWTAEHDEIPSHHFAEIIARTADQV
ncbi:hypothetical protein [Actinoplanes sp. OR16]|nr:hypothetical protein [Actinoplanes sp. OR16]